MKTIIVDDERLILKQLEREIAKNPRMEIAETFLLSSKALEYAKNHLVEAAFLDIEMPTMNGIELGKKLKELYPEIVLIYVSGYSDYVKEAMLDVKSDYYLLKPFSAKDIGEVVDRALLLSVRQTKSVFIHTFGRFEIYVNGEVIHFTNAKAKELFALCVDHLGGAVTMEESVEKLWGNRPYDEKVKNLYRKAVSYLNSLFSHIGHSKIFSNERGKCFINISEVDCDYKDYVLHKNSNGVIFQGEYMLDYDWARETEAKLLGMQ